LSPGIPLAGLLGEKDRKSGRKTGVSWHHDLRALSPLAPQTHQPANSLLTGLMHRRGRAVRDFKRTWRPASDWFASGGLWSVNPIQRPRPDSLGSGAV